MAIAFRPDGRELPASRPDAVGPAPIRQLLRQFEALLMTIPSAAYYGALAEGEPAICAHVGVSLNLIDILLSGGCSNTILYTPAAPGADANEMLAKVHALVRGLAFWPSPPIDAPMAVEHLHPLLGIVEDGWSTFETEAAFVVSHVVDRQRLIARLLTSFGLPCPDGFGTTDLPPLRARTSLPPFRHES